MKKLLCAILSAALLTGCAPVPNTPPPESVSAADFETKWAESGFVRIRLDNAMPAVTLPEGMDEGAVTIAHDILYYEEGHDESYGEGESREAHTAEEAAQHTVVHINAPGTYVLTGKLSLGQIAVDLGEGAKFDPNAVVTLILDGADITCTVAPAVIFYNVYECGDAKNPTAAVDTAGAGANVVLADGSRNYVTGSHVAKIYQPGTDKKLHKYDAAFYSRMSMNVGGEGFLSICADNEGLGTEMHLTINSGEIDIRSGNDGINTNEDGVSVTTVNGGTLRIEVTGQTGEGDGIDSNGWLVVSGGSIFAYACGTSGDAGIDSDLGIQINGGVVCATGNMLDRIEENSQTHAVFSFARRQEPGVYTLKDDQDKIIMESEAPNAFQYLLLSSPALAESVYTLWSGDTQFAGYSTGSSFFGKIEPIDRPEWPGRDDGDVEIPPQPTNPVVTHGTVQPPQGEQPENMPVPDFQEGFAPGQMPVPPMPQEGENMPMPNMPEGINPPQGGFSGQVIPISPVSGVLSPEFHLRTGANYFSLVQPAE